MLLLRCLLLALIAFLLAVPLLRKQASPENKGWLLIPKENISEAYPKFKPQIDSLFKAGYSFHYFNPGFQKADLFKVLTDASLIKHAADSSAQKSSYWSLLQQLDQQVVSGVPVYLFTPATFLHFIGDRPAVALKLNWKTYTPADTVTTWIQSAWFTDDNNISVTEGNTQPSGTYFTRTLIRSGEQQNTPYAVSVGSGRPEINIKNTGNGIIQTPVTIDTSTLKYAVVDDKNAVDAGYIMAALKAVAGFTQHKAIIKQYNSSSPIPPGQDWLFWLSDKTVNTATLQVARNILTYQNGKTENINSWLIAGNGYPLAQNEAEIPLYKLVDANVTKGRLIWHDGFGRPVLSVEQQGKTNLYHFYSRFNPAWNELVWSDDFPKMLLKLVSAGNQMIPYDKRVIDEKQVQPLMNDEKQAVTQKITGEIGLGHYLWLMMILMLIAERWLAHRNKGLQNG